LSRLLILFVGVPLMLLEIIADAVAEQTDMEVKDSFDTCDALLSVEPPPTADVLILSTTSDGLAKACGDLLYAYPKARFLAITNDGRGAFLYKLRPQRLAVGELTLDALLAAIRGDVSSPSSAWNEVIADRQEGNSHVNMVKRTSPPS